MAHGDSEQDEVQCRKIPKGNYIDSVLVRSGQQMDRLAQRGQQSMDVGGWIGLCLCFHENETKKPFD